jgi:Deoxyribonuclease NucA/NucB
MLFSVQLLALVAVASANKVFDWDCTKSIKTCNNACYAIHCRGAHSTLTYDSDKKADDDRRKLSGCDANPCNTKPTKDTYGKFGGTCDEFPFASVKEGGKDATLRCVPGPDNSSMYCPYLH